MCSCGEYFEVPVSSKREDCDTCHQRARGMRSSPLYNTWSVNYNKQWPDFFDFYREVGEPPGMNYMLSGEVPGTRPSPGNVRWLERSMTLGPIDFKTTTNYDEMLFDNGELHKLNKAAWHAANQDPNSLITHLEHLILLLYLRGGHRVFSYRDHEAASSRLREGRCKSTCSQRSTTLVSSKVKLSVETSQGRPAGHVPTP